MSILVDTSVIIDFLRSNKDRNFETLAEAGEIIISDLVRLELLRGVSKGIWPSFKEKLNGFSQLSLEKADLERTEELLFDLKDSGLSGGIVDLLLVAQASRQKLSLWTLDRKLYRVADFLGCPLWKD